MSGRPASRACRRKAEERDEAAGRRPFTSQEEYEAAVLDRGMSAVDRYESGVDRDRSAGDRARLIALSPGTNETPGVRRVECLPVDGLGG